LISESILQSIQASDLTSAVRRVPGVTISRYNPVGAYGGSDGGGIFIRGHGSGRPGADISTMIDGVPLFVGVWTHPLIDTLSIDLAKSVEVMKSPQPVRFGNMGFGAVNLIPKKAEKTGQSGYLESAYGRYETVTLRGEYAYRGESSGVLLSGSQRSSEGHRSDADGEVTAFYGNLFFELGEGWRFSVLGSATDSWANDPEPIGTSLPITEKYTTENRFMLAKIDYQGEDYQWELKAHIEDGTGSWRQWHQPPPPPFPGQTLITDTEYLNSGIKSVLAGSLSDDFEWRIGFDWDRYGGSVDEAYALAPDNSFEDQHFELWSPWVQMSKTWDLPSNGDAIVFSAGGRYLNHSVFEESQVGQLMATYRTDSLQTYFQLSHSVNYPGVFVSVFGRRGPPWQIGDQWSALSPETIDHLEAGLRWSVSDHWSVNVSLFQDEVDDSIRFVTPPPVGFINNEGSYTIEGVESILRYRGATGSVFVGMTWMDASQERPNLPEWSGIVGLHLENGPWSFNLDFQRFSEQTVDNPRFPGVLSSIDGYQLLSSRVSYRQLFPAGSVTYYLSGENLTNESYEYRPGYPMPGLSMTAGIRLEL